MLVQCKTCMQAFDDEFRDTGCPHRTFAANDGANNFAHHPESYLGPVKDAPNAVMPLDKPQLSISTHNAFGREYALVSAVKENTVLVPDENFSCVCKDDRLVIK